MTTTPPKRRRVKGGPIGPRKPTRDTVAPPKCAKHYHEMVFDGLMQVWRCPDPGCKMVAHPQVDLGGPRPIIFDSDFELVVVRKKDNGGNHFVVRHGKVFFDLTNYVTFASQDLASNGYRTELVFPQYTEVDE